MLNGSPALRVAQTEYNAWITVNPYSSDHVGLMDSLRLTVGPNGMDRWCHTVSPDLADRSHHGQPGQS